MSSVVYEMQLCIFLLVWIVIVSVKSSDEVKKNKEFSSTRLGIKISSMNYKDILNIQ